MYQCRKDQSDRTPVWRCERCDFTTSIRLLILRHRKRCTTPVALLHQLGCVSEPATETVSERSRIGQPPFQNVRYLTEGNGFDHRNSILRQGLPLEECESGTNFGGGMQTFDNSQAHLYPHQFAPFPAESENTAGSIGEHSYGVSVCEPTRDIRFAPNSNGQEGTHHTTIRVPSHTHSNLTNMNTQPESASGRLGLPSLARFLEGPSRFTHVRGFSSNATVNYYESDVDTLGDDDIDLFDVEEVWDPGFRGNYDIGQEVFRFFRCFQDRVCKMYPSVQRPADERSVFPDQFRSVAHRCIAMRRSRPQIEEIYEIVRESIEGVVGHSAYSLSELLRQYPTATEFAERLVLERKVLVREQGWMSAHINIRGEEQVGYFIPLVHAVEQVLDTEAASGGLTDFHEEYTESGERIYSDITNCDAMKAYVGDGRSTSREVFVSIYCDGTQVANCGSTECCVIRMRVDNMKGGHNNWKDIGIAPTLMLKRSTLSNAELTDARLELYQRFVFLVIESASPYSATYAARNRIQVRILSLVTDRPQERTSLCLYKAVGTERICSICRARKNETDDSTCSEKRRVTETVTAQLEMAILKRLKDQSIARLINLSMRWGIFRELDGEALKKRREYLQRYLKQESAKAFPPALVVLSGIGTKPYLLYNLPGFDPLHVMDLGVIRLFADSLHIVFSRPFFRGNHSKASFIRIMNKRLNELFICSTLRNTTPIKTTPDEKQASYTGKQWRAVAEVLPLAVIGLNRSCCPDEDIVTQAALALDLQQAILKGANKGEDFMSLTATDIAEIDGFSKGLVMVLAELFQCGINSKLHRLAFHVGDNFKNFGSISFTDTSVNETLHRGLKQSYSSTNKRKLGIGMQLVTVNLPADIMEESAVRSFARKSRKFLTTDRTLTHQEVNQIQNMAGSSYAETLLHQIRAAELANQYMETLQSNQNYGTVEKAYTALTNVRNGIQGRVFHPLMKGVIAAKIPWICKTDTFVRQILYASDSFEAWGARHDAVTFEQDAQKLFNRTCNADFQSIGIVQGFLRLKTDEPRKPTVAVIRVLDPAEPQPGNVRIVTDFRFRRFKYKRAGADVCLVCVPILSIGRRYNLVKDLYEVISRTDDEGSFLHSYQTTLSDIEETSEERLQSFFFHVPNCRVSVFGEKDVEEEVEGE